MADLHTISDLLSQSSATANAEAQSRPATPGFSETLKGLIDQVNELQKNSGVQIQEFVAGRQGNLHEVMAAIEEAQLGFQLMVEVRNKLLESYQELMRMQV